MAASFVYYPSAKRMELPFSEKKFKMFDRVIAETNVRSECVRNFNDAVDIYLFKMHVVNKKLFGVENVSILSMQNLLRPAPVKFAQLLHEISEIPLDQFVPETRHICAKHGVGATEEKLFDGSTVELRGSENDGLIVLNRLLPKNINVFQPLDVVCLIDRAHRSVYLKCRQKDEANTLFPKFPFALQVIENTLSIRCSSSDHTDERSMFWLQDVLFGRMQKWMERSCVPGPSVRSLSLIDNLEEYNCLFNELKVKYGQRMVAIWPECTDPQKFVFEDIAIATYLLLLWRRERADTGEEKLQSFVDVGCGNGLLVYILASEGHRGYGIDLRKRKLWDLYPAALVDLRVQTLIPSSASLFPDIDWIIGNHSDELSPWIPVIAARSSPSCRFFLLPCCAYEFDGSKYQREDSRLSQYGEFLKYANRIAKVCGFRVETDRLRIPSTKRTCLIGFSRIYPQSEYENYDNEIQYFINARSKTTNTVQEETTDPSIDSWSSSFRPRESTEKVRNCTKIDRSIIDKIVMIVFDELLAKRRVLPEFIDRNWNSGGTLTMEELVGAIPQEHLTALKAECGGLQTLLRNNHQVFRVEKGTVQIRVPTTISTTIDVGSAKKRKKVKNFKPVNLKQRLCWFFAHHPEGCPLDENECRFNHGS